MVTAGLQRQVKCRDCETQVAYVPILFQGKELFSACVVCDPCSEKLVSAKKEEGDKGRRESWSTICPPLYQDTDIGNLPIDPQVMREVLSWKVGPKGIGIVGATGLGKTRLMFLLLANLFASHLRILAITAKRFENCCHRMFDKNDDARGIISECKSVPILFIDDIGKEKYTERVESEFYDLIETRTSHLRPILWTANSGGDKLVAMMGADRGTPIVRRLREFSTVFSV